MTEALREDVTLALSRSQFHTGRSVAAMFPLRPTVISEGALALKKMNVLKCVNDCVSCSRATHELITDVYHFSRALPVLMPAPCRCGHQASLLYS